MESSTIGYDITNLGPLDGSHVLVVPLTMGFDEMETLADALIGHARERGLTGPAALHVPLIVAVPDVSEVADLDEAAMGEYGWRRTP